MRHYNVFPVKDVAVLVTNMNKKNVAYEKDTIKSLPLRCESQKRKKQDMNVCTSHLRNVGKALTGTKFLEQSLLLLSPERLMSYYIHIYKYITGA